MPPLEQYSIVSGDPNRVVAYTGTDLAQVLGISMPVRMPEGTYGWMLLCGEVPVRTSDGTRTAYADFQPNDAKAHLRGDAEQTLQTSAVKPPSGTLDEEAANRQRYERLAQLPALLIEVGMYCSLLKEARGVFVDGHFYACVAMCGISFERFQRDKAAPFGADAGAYMSDVRRILKQNDVLSASSIMLCKKMAELRNDYAHGNGANPRADALTALGWMHDFIDAETNLMRNYKITDGVLEKKAPS